MDFNLSVLTEHFKESFLQLCPIIASVNWKRRATDDSNGVNHFKQFLIRTAISIFVAAIIGIGSGMLSAYIMVQTMQVRIDNVNIKVDKLEDRFYRFTDKAGHD